MNSKMSFLKWATDKVLFFVALKIHEHLIFHKIGNLGAVGGLLR